MSHPYELRSRTYSPNYKEKEEYDDEIDDELQDKAADLEDKDLRKEDLSPRRPRNRNTSRRPDSSQSDTSHLSSVPSDSFSFHSGSSPSATGQSEKLYPSLSRRNREQDRSPQRSPGPKRRLYPEVDSSPSSSPENGSPDRRQKKFSPTATKLRKSHLEPTYFGFTAKEWKFFFFMFIFALAMLAVISVFVLVITSFKSRTASQADVEKVSDFDKFSKQVQGLEQQFPSQTNRFWRVVKASARHLFIPELATYPAVLLMVGEKKHAAFTSSIAEAIQHEFESVKLHSPIQARRKPLNLTASVTKMDVDQQKLHLDEWLRKSLDHNQVAVVVNHLEVLLPESSLLIYAYCDSDNAPYKDVMLIFGLFFDYPVNTSQAAENAMRQLWMSDYMADKIGGVLSRVANNIALVNGPAS